MIQHVDGVHSKFEFLRFRNSHTLDEVRVEIKAWRAFDPFQPETAVVSRRGVYQKKVALRIRNRLIAEYAIESVGGRHSANGRIGDLLSAGEENHAIVYFGHLPYVLRKRAHDACSFPRVEKLRICKPRKIQADFR